MPPISPITLPWNKTIRWGIRIGTLAWALTEAYLDEEQQMDADELEWRQLQIVFARTTPAGTAEDRAVCTLDFINITDDSFDSSWTAGDYTTLEALLDTFCTSMQGNSLNNHTIVEYRWFARSFRSTMTATHRFNPNGPPTRVVVKSIAGTNPTTTAAMAYQVATSVTERTSMAAHWGRFYWPGMGPTALDSNGRIKTSVVDSFATLTQTLFKGAANAELPVVVPVTQIAGAIGGAILPVIQVQVDDIPDIQRRRRPKQVGYRKQILIST